MTHDVPLWLAVSKVARMVETGQGRVRQRRRTHDALLAAAGRLLAKGQVPTVAEIADEALVSRRTAYRHFPTAEQLLVDAALEATGPAVLQALDSDDPLTRVDQLIRQLHSTMDETEPLLRNLIRLTVDRPPDAEGPSRGYRRVAWVEEALEPLREQLDAVAWQRLVAAVCLTVGIEAQLVLRDVVGLGRGEVLEVERWAARTLVRAALEPGDVRAGDHLRDFRPDE